MAGQEEVAQPRRGQGTEGQEVLGMVWLVSRVRQRWLARRRWLSQGGVRGQRARRS